MIKNLTILIVLGISSLVYSQQSSGEYKTYSYTEFFELIEQETDTIFELNDAVVQFNEQTDERFRFVINPLTDSIFNPSEQIVIDKSINLNNVHFSSRGWRYPDKHEDIGSIWNVHFKRNVTINNTASFNINNCKFDGSFYSSSNKLCSVNIDELRSLINSPNINITRSEFNDFGLFKTCPADANTFRIYTQIIKNKFTSKLLKRGFGLYLYDNSSIGFHENEINNTIGTTFIRFSTLTSVDITNNHFNTKDVLFSIVRKERELTFSGNRFSSYVHFYTDKLDNQDYVEYTQIKNHFIPLKAFFDNYDSDEAFRGLRFQELDTEEQLKLNQKYLDSVRYYNSSAFSRDMASKGLLYDHYKNKYETETANQVYMEMKDMETRRLEVLYEQNPSFKTYFKWKVNQFLKMFSDYGTEPAKAIVFSVYVILFFAVIYLFFPNSWDKHGKNRIVDRYNFFFKYMKRKAGIHEVYLEDQKEELMSYDQFKANISDSKQKVPKFFTATALPLYKWAVSGTRFSASILKRIDIISGTWQDLPPSKRVWKSVLLIGAFTIAIIYDLFIKILNALMLSINTFTTLGFGEIPIKGLPRYLAIIQGFIGWFMLTIFSVSLISQLLN